MDGHDRCVSCRGHPRQYPSMIAPRSLLAVVKRLDHDFTVFVCLGMDRAVLQPIGVKTRTTAFIITPCLLARRFRVGHRKRLSHRVSVSLTSGSILAPVTQLFCPKGLPFGSKLCGLVFGAGWGCRHTLQLLRASVAWRKNIAIMNRPCFVNPFVCLGNRLRSHQRHE